MHPNNTLLNVTFMTIQMRTEIFFSTLDGGILLTNLNIIIKLQIFKVSITSKREKKTLMESINNTYFEYCF